ncbi:MAG: hypothetical protein RPR28_06445 [Cycloclasticus sp.]
MDEKNYQYGEYMDESFWFKDRDLVTVEAYFNSIKEPTMTTKLARDGYPYWYGNNKTLLVKPNGLPGYILSAGHGAGWFRAGQGQLFKGKGYNDLIAHLNSLNNDDGDRWVEEGHLSVFNELIYLGGISKRIH